MAKTKSTLTRTYQGRITSVRICSSSKKKKQQESLPVENWEELFWEYHVLFQDAVNYYLIALAALASDHNSSAGKLKARIEEAWNKPDSPLRESLKRVFDISRETTAAEIFKLVLAGNCSSPMVLQEVIDLLLNKLGGDIQQGGKDFFPQLCVKTFKGNYEGDLAKELKHWGDKNLPHFFHSDQLETSLEKLSDILQFEFFALPQKVKEGEPQYKSPNEVRNDIDRYIAFLVNFKKLSFDEADRLKGRVEKMSDHQLEGKLLRYGAINKNPLKERFAAYLLYHFVEQSELTVNLFRSSYKAPKKIKIVEFSKIKKSASSSISRAREKSSFIFPAFSSLKKLWVVEKESEDPSSRKFDILAFQEALKVINQFDNKTAEREERKNQLKKIHDFQLTGTGSLKNNKEIDDEEDLPTFYGDKRIELLKHLLEKELTIENEGGANSYGLQSRTLKGFNKLAEKWNVLLQKNGGDDPTIEGKLQDLVKESQKNDSNFGGASLFLELCRRQYWPIWRTPSESEVAERRANSHSFNVLQDYKCFLDREKELERLREDIKFTPASAETSPRHLMFDNRQVDWSGRSTFKIECPYKNEQGLFVKGVVEVTFSAPRLLRNSVYSQNGKHKELDWRQPIYKPFLNEKELDLLSDTFKSPVMLLPHRKLGRIGKVSSDYEMLVNFPLTLKVSARELQNSEKWEENCYREKKGSGKSEEWVPRQLDWTKEWKDRKSNFTCLSVDFGQRFAAATAVLSAQKGASEVGRFIGSTDSGNWYVRLTAYNTIRLPGEDTKTFRHGKLSEEFYGKRGRLASSEETEEFSRLLGELEVEKIKFKPEDLSFPEQNDQLIHHARAALQKIGRLQRWTEFLSSNDPEKENKVREETLDSELSSWCELVNAGDQWKEFTLTELKRRIESRMSLIPAVLCRICDRTLPQRKARWSWQKRVINPKYYHLTTYPDPSFKPKVKGQRGLSFARLEQLERLRRLFQSLHYREVLKDKDGSRILDKEEKLPECSERILKKLEGLKDQRVKQTANAIVAQALGVRRMPHNQAWSEFRTRRDIHGEYERIPGREPVDFVVIENLSRYLTSQDRSRRENSRLMKWCHRELASCIKQLLEPFGITLLHAPAAYSSKFCSRTGAGGFRASELTLRDFELPYWKHLKEQDDDEGKFLNEVYNQLLELRMLNRPKITLLVPNGGGEMFIPLYEKGSIMQADINAAINIGLRAVAHPAVNDIHTRVRCEWKEGRLLPRKKNNFEKDRFKESTQFSTEGINGVNAESHYVNAFYDPNSLAQFEKCSIQNTTFALSKGFWTAVKNKRFERCRFLNDERISKWTQKIEEKPIQRSEIGLMQSYSDSEPNQST